MQTKKTNKEEVSKCYKKCQKYWDDINGGCPCSCHSTLKPKKEYCDCLTLLDHYNNKWNDKFPPPNHPAFDSTPKPSVKESWNLSKEDKEIWHDLTYLLPSGIMPMEWKAIIDKVKLMLETARKETYKKGYNDAENHYEDILKAVSKLPPVPKSDTE